MTQLPESWHDLVNSLADGGAAWRTPEQIAAAIGGEIEETTDLLASLDAAGLVDVWERDDGPVVTLSPLGASVAKLKIIEYGPDETPRWVRIGDPLPPLPRARGVAANARAAMLDDLVDPKSPRDAGDRASNEPTLLIGLGTTPWPTATRESTPVCPVCGNRRLPTHAYCLWCDRWGGETTDREKPCRNSPAKVPGSPPTRDRAAEELAARAARKAKQRLRMSERVRQFKQPQRGGTAHSKS